MNKYNLEELSKYIDTQNNDWISKNCFYEEDVPYFNRLYRNKKIILFKCLETYMQRYPEIDCRKVFQIFYNKIGFEEFLDSNASIFKSISDINQEFIDNLIYLMLHNKALKNKDNVFNYFKNNAALCDSIYRQIRNHSNQYLEFDGEDLNFCYDIKSLKCLIFMKKYHISLQFAEEFLSVFSEDIDKIDAPTQILKLFQDLAYLDSIQDVEELRKIYENIPIQNEVIDFFSIYNHLAFLFSKKYIEECYRPNIEDFSHTLDGVQVYEAPESCFMLVHVLGGFFLDNITLENGYLSDWNSRKKNYISMSAIGTEFSETCEVKEVCYGFYNFNPHNILGSSAKNLGIHHNEKENDKYYPMAGTSLFCGISSNRGNDKFCLPHTLLKESDKVCDRNDYIHENEVAYKRFDDEERIMKPDYVVYFSDTSDETLLAKSIVAAREFDIPIVMVSKKKWLSYKNSIVENNTKPQK